MSRLRMFAMWVLRVWSPGVQMSRGVRDGLARGFGEHGPPPPRSTAYRAGIPTFCEVLRGRFDE